MRIGITGASGFIGGVLVRQLRERGHDPVAFSRNPARPVAGCRETRAVSPAPDVSGLDAVVNLAGESILGPWTAAKRERIIASRVRTTEAIASAMTDAADRGNGPRVLVNASATGFYGDAGDAVRDEDAPPGPGFLADVARRWEEAAAPAARTTGVRVSFARIGFVLGREGGTWPLLRRVFRLGLGGRLGDGQQWMSVVHGEDVAGLLAFLVENDAASGPFNAVCPEPVRNADFTRAVAAALHRPAVLPAPAFVLKTMLGDLSHLLLDSQRVVPTRTLAAGFRFRFPTLRTMLTAMTNDQ